MTDQFTVVDLFAGAGGLSSGVANACEKLGLERGTDVELHAINHWEPAIETHEHNHSWANHYHAKIEELHPPDIVDPDSVTLLTGGPECTHFSTARGGKPVNEQKRASAWHVLDWIEKLRPKHVLLENVKEFRQWGPIEDGTPTRDGSIFERWIGMLEALGYSVVYDSGAENYGVVLNAADYGDPQSRDRLFIMASRENRPTVPEPTHVDGVPGKPNRRTAADIIDWSDQGTSVWTRDLEHPRVQPLSQTTMARIAEGIRRHCDDRLEQFADTLETIDADRLEQLRKTVIPLEKASTVADAVDEPFLVRCPGDRILLSSPSKTVSESICLRQQSGGVPLETDEPLATVSTKGAIGLATVHARTLVKPRNGAYRGTHSNPLYDPHSRPLHTVTAKNHDGHLVTPTLVDYSHQGRRLSSPYLCPLYNGRKGQRPRTRDVERPLMTVPASKSPAGIAAPYLVDYHGNSNAAAVDDPIGTIETKDRYALCVPEYWPWGIDVSYRMLQPDELKQAQGFPDEYEIQGDTKADIIAQIGNAVPVHLAQALCRHLLANETPSLSSYGGGISPEPETVIPDYDTLEDIATESD